MRAPIARAPQRANRQDDSDRSSPRVLQPLARMRVRPRASSSPPLRAQPPPIPKARVIAPAEQLERLPGVGPRTAVRIVEYRQKNGGFKKVEELMNVRGIGEKAFLKMKNQLTVTAPRAEQQ